MRFGSQTGLASVLGSLGLNSEINILDSAAGVVEGIDALSRSAAALHHMTVVNNIGEDVTPDEYETLIQANMARPLSSLIGSLSVAQPLLQGYTIPRRELIQNRQTSPGAILTTTVQNRRIWANVCPDENAAYWEDFVLTELAWRPASQREPLTDFINATATSYLDNDGSSIILSMDGDRYAISLFTVGDLIHVTTWKESTSTTVEHTYSLPKFTTQVGFGSVKGINDHAILPVCLMGDNRTLREGVTAASYRMNGVWTPNVTLTAAAYHFIIAPEISVTQATLDKGLVAGLISARMIVDSAN